VANRPIGNLFVGQDANALLQSFTSPAFGPSSSPTIAANQAVLVRAVYFLGLIVVATGQLRLGTSARVSFRRVDSLAHS